MPFFGNGNPELILVTHWVATLQPGKNYQVSKSYLEQDRIKEHLAYYHKMLERQEVLMGGPWASLGAELIIFNDRVSNYDEAKAILDRDPTVANGVFDVRIEEWFSNAIGGGRDHFFSEDTAEVRQNGRLFVETGYGVLLEQEGSKLIGEVAEQIGGLFGGEKEAKEAEKEGQKIGADVGTKVGRFLADVVTAVQGADEKQGKPLVDPPVKQIPEEDLPDGSPLPYFTTRFVCLLFPGKNYDGRVLTPKQPWAKEHVACIERYVLDGKMLMAGPVATFFFAYLVFTEEVDTWEMAKQLIDADPAVVEGVLDSTIVEWFCNVRKGEASGFFAKDTPQLRATAQELISAGFYPVRSDSNDAG